MIAWVVILAAIMIPLSFNAPKFDNDIKMSGLKSLDTNDKIENILTKIVKRHPYVVLKSSSDNGIVSKSMTKDIKH